MFHRFPILFWASSADDIAAECKNVPDGLRASSPRPDRRPPASASRWPSGVLETLLRRNKDAEPAEEGSLLFVRSGVLAIAPAAIAAETELARQGRAAP